MIAQLTGATHQAKTKARNEDCFVLDGLVATGPAAAPVTVSLPVASPALACVADGLGGHPAGDVASVLAGRVIAARRHQLASPEAIVACVESASDALLAEMACHPTVAGMATTIAGVVVGPQGAWVFSVGDSGVYELVDGFLVQRSIEDSNTQAPGAISQVLGGPVRRSIDVHVAPLEVCSGLRLLVCSDGLTRPVGPELIERALADPDAAGSVEQLIAAAVDCGLPDDVTVVMVELGDGERG